MGKCPFLMISAVRQECQKEKCEWWVPIKSGSHEGKCAIWLLGYFKIRLSKTS
jgi:hypothetical protein